MVLQANEMPEMQKSITKINKRINSTIIMAYELNQ